MKPRSIVAAVLTCTTLSLALPARAQETGAASLVETQAPRLWTPLKTPDVLGIDGHSLALRTTLDLERARARLPANAATEEIRLSSGAKTAIIVVAVVVGVLLIVGVLAIGKPHHLH